MRESIGCRIILIVLALAVGMSVASAQTVPLLITSLSPDAAPAGTPGLLLTISGIGFAPGATAFWQNSPLPTTFVSGTQLRATLSAAQLATAGTAAVFVTNLSGQRTTDLIFTIRTPEFGIATEALPAATSQTPYAATLTAIGGTAPYTWQARDSLPPGVSLSPAGVLSGTPTTQGTFTFTVQVTDAQSRTAARALALVVSPGRFSIVTESMLPAANEGSPYTQTLRTEAGRAPVRWTSASLPPGLTLDSATGVLSGTPNTAGTYNIPVQATDASGASASKTLTLEVRPSPVTITSVSPLFTASRGTPYAYTFAVTGGQGPYRWSMQPIVPGLTLDPGTGALSGTPVTSGTFNFTVEVTDAVNARTSRGFSITVEEPRLTITNASPLPAGAVGEPYSQRFLAAGGRAPYTWSIVAGDVPGLTLNPVTGVLTDVPAAPGTFGLTVQVRDSSGLTTSKPYLVTIAAGPLELSTPTEPLKAIVGQPVSSNIVLLRGGTPPFTFSANGLPDGVTIDPTTGRIFGTATAPGSFPFTVRVTDATRANATELYQLEVAAPALPSLTVPNISAVVAPADQPRVQLRLDNPYDLPLNGQLLLSFTPDAGPGDPAVQFSTGGRTVDFTVAVGATTAEFPAGDLAFQTGTVAGSISLQVRLASSGFTLTPTPIAVRTVRVERTAPAITSATFTRTGTTIEVRVIGYSTTREVTQATFRFSAATGQTLRASEVTVPAEQLFSQWYGNSQSAAFGGQFSFRQQFTIEGDANAVTPAAVTLTNRVGSSTADIRPQ